MLKIDGSVLMNKFHMKPGPRIGNTLNALLEEVLDDSTKNTEEYLEKRVSELMLLDDNELKKLGDSGKTKREAAEDEEIQKIMEKHHVC